MAILGLDGNELVKQQRMQFSPDDARLIRQYKRLLQRYDMAASHFCRACQRSDRDYEVRIKVNDGQIEFECPHRMITFHGSTL